MNLKLRCTASVIYGAVRWCILYTITLYTVPKYIIYIYIIIYVYYYLHRDACVNDFRNNESTVRII